jgi:hypothetical protein
VAKARRGADRDNFGAKSVAPGSAPAVPTPSEEEIPEELATVWDKDVAESFRGLRPKHQDFLLAYIREGNAAAAYRKAYNALAKDHLASVCGSQVLATTGIQTVLKRFQDRKVEALFLVQKTLIEAAEGATKPIFGKDDEGQPILVMEQPDHAVRIKAAESLAKLHGLNAAEEVKTQVTGQIVHVYAPQKKPEGHGSGQPG